MNALRYIAVALVGIAAGAGGWYAFVGSGSEVEREIGDEGSISVCSFNIQFLGQSTRREDAALAELVRDFDIVVVQELVAPPRRFDFGGDDVVNADPQSASFFQQMASRGFQNVLSEEDTGTGPTNHLNSTATEWWVAFYKPSRLTVADDLPHGFLAADHTDHPNYERVPYAFAFRTPDRHLDFVLISVHLKPGNGPANRARRAEEMGAVAAWIDANDAEEHDFVILGDFNFQNKRELIDVTPAGMFSINNQFLRTNTGETPRGYDHVFLSPYYTSEVDLAFGFMVIDLVESMAEPWSEHHDEPYPGAPYDHDRFRAAYSDHDPVVFKLTLPPEDDDG